MDGLVIESISLLTLLEVGDVPHYEQLKPGDILLDFPGVWLALSEDWKGIGSWHRRRGSSVVQTEDGPPGSQSWPSGMQPS